MPYCSKCGNELKENTKFCSKCGTAVNGDSESSTIKQENDSGINCPKCGALVPFGNTVCLKCGSPLTEESHAVAIVLGYAGTILGSLIFPILG